jgi:short-subunit dehydrogenase
MKRNLTWNTALITGATTGIGAALARRLVARGTRVAICGRRVELLNNMRRELGDAVVTIEADLTHTDRAIQVVSEAKEGLGSLDLVVANAGSRINKPATSIEPWEILTVLQLNLLGACATLTAAIPDMVAQGYGHLVGISSIAGIRGFPMSAAYSASKAALSTFLESIRVDLSRSGIKVSDIRPGFIDTPLTETNTFKMPFLMSADEAARLILRAVERERRVYTFPWQMAIAARFLSHVPAVFYDRFSSRESQVKSSGPESNLPN